MVFLTFAVGAILLVRRIPKAKSDQVSLDAMRIRPTRLMFALSVGFALRLVS